MQQKKRIIGIDTRDLKIAKTGAHTYLSELCKTIQNNQADLQFEYVFLDTSLPIYTGSSKLGKVVGTNQLHHLETNNPAI